MEGVNPCSAGNPDGALESVRESGKRCKQRTLQIHPFIHSFIQSMLSQLALCAR